MRVFLAGASGAIGRPLVGQLLAAGHQVTGMTRRDDRATEIRAAGADCVVCDVFDAEALGAAVAKARPEVVVHELTALPQELDPRKRDVYEANNRIRSDGTRNLVIAARAAGARRMVAQSIAFIYAAGPGGRIKSEADPVLTDVPGGFGEAVEATLDLERQVLGAEGIDGVVMRYGFFYGPRTGYAPDGYQARLVRKRRFPIIAEGAGTFSFVHVEDAAAATVSACERGGPGIYNVCDDEPAPQRDWLPIYAEAIGAKRPRRLPVWLVRMLAGRRTVAFATGLQGASNARAKRELGWRPRYPSWRRGFTEALG